VLMQIRIVYEYWPETTQ